MQRRHRSRWSRTTPACCWRATCAGTTSSTCSPNMRPTAMRSPRSARRTRPRSRARPQGGARILRACQDWERRADQLVMDARAPPRRDRAGGLRRAGGDRRRRRRRALEEAAFLLADRRRPPPGLARRVQQTMQLLADAVLGAAQDHVRALEIARLRRDSSAEDHEAFVAALWRVLNAERQCDVLLRDVRRALAEHVSDAATLNLSTGLRPGARVGHRLAAGDRLDACAGWSSAARGGAMSAQHNGRVRMMAHPVGVHAGPTPPRRPPDPRRRALPADCSAAALGQGLEPRAWPRSGLPVPPAFVIGTGWCAEPGALAEAAWRPALAELERLSGLRLGDTPSAAAFGALRRAGVDAGDDGDPARHRPHRDHAVRPAARQRPSTPGMPTGA